MYIDVPVRHESMQSPHTAPINPNRQRDADLAFSPSRHSPTSTSPTRGPSRRTPIQPRDGTTQQTHLIPWSQTRTVPIIDPTAPRQRKKQATPNMPPRKSTSSVTAADPDDASLLSPVAPTSDKPITATEQQIKARAELGVSVDVSIPTLHSLLVFPQSA